MRIFGYDITIRKYRPLVPYVAPPPDVLTRKEVACLRESLGPAQYTPGSTRRCYPIRRFEFVVLANAETDDVMGPGPRYAHATVYPVRLLDTLEWAWALDNPVEEPTP